MSNQNSAYSKKHDFQTSASIRHRVRERLRESSPKPKVHRTVEDHLNCPTCSPKFEKAMLERGYKKPDLCPDCGTELKESFLGGKYCPKCSPSKGHAI